MKELAIHYTGWFHVDCAEPYGEGGWFLVLQQHGRTRVYRRDDTEGGWKKGREIPLKRDLYSLAGRTHNPACGFTLTNFEVDFFEGLSLEAQP